LLAFIAWPISALNAFSLPPLNFSTDFVFAASTTHADFASYIARHACLSRAGRMMHRSNLAAILGFL